MTKKRKLDAMAIHRMLKNKSVVVNFRMNPDLKEMLDEAIQKDDRYVKTTEWFEEYVLKYVAELGILEIEKG